MVHRVYLESGEKRVFAVSLDWPGWARQGRHADEAIERLLEYAPRYGAIVAQDFADDGLTVVGTIPGNATTDFGAPRVTGPWDDVASGPVVRDAHLAVLRRCWTYFDAVVAGSPATLLKGPRGGGRDRDEIVDHVREAERHYAPKIGARVAPRTDWSAQRAQVESSLRLHDGHQTWPVDYALRIIAWHVVDHAWEIEDRRP